MPNLLIVEDDVALAESLMRGFLENDFQSTNARTLQEAREELQKQEVDVCLLDLDLPDGSGFELLRELQQKSDPLPVLITTAHGELDERLQGLEGGAEDYLVKPYAFAELLARVRILLRRRLKDETRIRLGDLAIDTITRRAVRADHELDLTLREFDLLLHLAMASGSTVSRESLAREVWKMRSWTPSMDNVIDVHVSRLREKLDSDFEQKLIHTVRGVGFVLKEK